MLSSALTAISPASQLRRAIALVTCAADVATCSITTEKSETEKGPEERSTEAVETAATANPLVPEVEVEVEVAVAVEDVVSERECPGPVRPFFPMFSVPKRRGSPRVSIGKPKGRAHAGGAGSSRCQWRVPWRGGLCASPDRSSTRSRAAPRCRHRHRQRGSPISAWRLESGTSLDWWRRAPGRAHLSVHPCGPQPCPARGRGIAVGIEGLMAGCCAQC